MTGVYKMMSKALANSTIFVIAYLLFMIPAYLTYVDSSSTMLLRHSINIHIVNPALIIHLGSMLVLCLICNIRGALIGRRWLMLLPMIAIAFEFLPALSGIPYVPSVYHLLAIVIGISTSASVSPVHN
jgi:hypothetical protein